MTKKFNELYLKQFNETGTKPFAVEVVLTDGRIVNGVIVPIDENCFVEQSESGKAYSKVLYIQNCMNTFKYTVADSFLNDSLNESSCSCDLYSVLMVTGCKCGGQ